MPPEANNPSALLIMTAIALSFATLFHLFQKHIAGKPLLAYQPRRPVPWGPLVALFAASIPLISILLFFIGSKDSPAEEVSTQELLSDGWKNFAFMVLFVPTIMLWLIAFFRADAHDLGLPTSYKQLATDFGIGIFAAVASLLPIYAVQLTLVLILQSETQHPLVEQLQKHQSPQMLLLGFLMAVLAAPLFEEFTFRKLLQGWLERHEDERLAHNTALTPANRDRKGPEHPTAVAPPNTDRPSHGWFPALPHGWTPILISALAFGLAHLGHGVAPIPLVLFGIVLGYLYQRTHRLAPSIAAHMTFNAYSMTLLWLQLKSLPPT